MSTLSPQATFLNKYLDNWKLLWTFSCDYYSLGLWIQNKSSKRLIPTPGIEPGLRRWERRILTTRPRGMCAGVVRVFGYCSVMWSCIDQPPTGVHICKLSSLHYSSLMLITYFWSCCSAISHQTKAVCPPSGFNIVKEIQDGNRSGLKRKKTETGENFKTIYIK